MMKEEREEGGERSENKKKGKSSEMDEGMVGGLGLGW